MGLLKEDLVFIVRITCQSWGEYSANFEILKQFCIISVEVKRNQGWYNRKTAWKTSRNY